MQIAHPEEIEATHVPVSGYRVGPYYFLMAIPRGILVTEAVPAWWVAKWDKWLRRESFASLEDAMRYASQPTDENL